MKLKITVLFIVLMSTLTIAQAKVGTIDSEYIIGMMPETKKSCRDYKELWRKVRFNF